MLGSPMASRLPGLRRQFTTLDSSLGQDVAASVELAVIQPWHGLYTL